MVAVGEVGVEHGGEREAGEGDAQAGHQLGHTHRGGHGAMVQLPTLPTLWSSASTAHWDAAGLEAGLPGETSSGTRPTLPHCHTHTTKAYLQNCF